MKDLPSSSMEALSSASKISSVCNIIQNPREGVKDRVDEADWAFANGESLFVDL